MSAEHWAGILTVSAMLFVFLKEHGHKRHELFRKIKGAFKK